MNNEDLIAYFITKHNLHYLKYLQNWEEPRYELKTFFFNSYSLFKMLKEAWGGYLLGYSNLFKRDPANDYYKYRDPTDETMFRENSLEWTAAFEILAEVGPPYNESAVEDFFNFSKIFLIKISRAPPEQEWYDFMLCSAVANLPDKYPAIKSVIPAKIEKYLEHNPDPHQLMIYLKAINHYGDQTELKNRILSKLIAWINNPNGNMDRQITAWARLITRMQWVPELSMGEVKERIISNFKSSFNAVHNVFWTYSPMVLEALYLTGDKVEKDEIRQRLQESLAPASFIGLREVFRFLTFNNDVLEVKEEVLKVKEKCKTSVSMAECKDCMIRKKGDCWIRILSIVSETEPNLHSGYEVADKVIYSLQQGIYVVVKAEDILKQRDEGDILFRQCVNLFSVEHALVLYLNPYNTAPIVIEEIKKAASASKTDPRFEVIDPKYIRQIYKYYLENQ